MANASNKEHQQCANALEWLQKQNESLDHNGKNTVTFELGVDRTPGQWPRAVILSCADSRITPEYIFKAGIEDLFVIRVAGNIAETDAIASIEYAVANLGCEVVIVLGHQNCGAVGAAKAWLEGAELGDNLAHLVSQIAPAIQGHLSEPGEALVKLNADHAAKTLTTNSTILRTAVQKGDLTIISAYVDFDYNVDWYNGCSCSSGVTA